MRKSYAALLMAGAMTALVGCKDDMSNAGYNDGLNDVEGGGYVAFSIKTDLSTRATTGDVPNSDGNPDDIFNPGSPDEYAISPNSKAHLAVFFDKDGVFFNTANLDAFDKANAGTGTSDDGLNKFYSFVTRYKYSDSQENVPASVLVLVNTDPTKLQDIRNQLEAGKPTLSNMLQWISYYAGDAWSDSRSVGLYNDGTTNYFTMTNSAYFDASGNPMIAQPLTENGEFQVYDSPEDALANSVKIYVERMLAKHTLTFQANGENEAVFLNGNNSAPYVITPDLAGNNDSFRTEIRYIASYPEAGADQDIYLLDSPEGEKVDWKVYVAGWGMNGVEPNSFYFKNVFDNSYASKNYATDWTSPTFFNNWNFDALHRSYWGVDQHYLENGNYGFGTSRSEYGYPQQYRSSDLDREGKTGLGVFTGNIYGEQNEGPASLNFMSYNNLRGRAAHNYTLENTYADEAGLKGYGPYWYDTHVLLTAQLILGNGIDYNDGEDFSSSHVNANGLFNGLGGSAKEKYMVDNLCFADATGYIRYAYHHVAKSFANGVKKSVENVLGNSADDLIDVAPEGVALYADAQGQTAVTVTNAENYFELAPANVAHGDGRVTIKGKQTLYYKEGNSYKPLTDGQLVSLVYNYSQPAKHFNQGMMYYAIPVQHLKGVSKGSRVEIDKNNSYDLGQFGVVRNHWYRFNVKSVSGFGIPVDDPDQPIIPSPEDDYYVAFEIVILPWHVIDNGEVDLK